MKKYLFFAAALVALASCSDEKFVGKGNGPTNETEATAISFGSSNAAITRAVQTGKAAADSLRNHFVVKGVKTISASTSTVFDHYNVNYTNGTSYQSTTNTTGWEYVGILPNALTELPNPETNYQTVKYWDYSASQYDFIAFSEGSATAIYSGSPSDGQVLYTRITPGTMTSSTGGAFTIKGKAKDVTKTFISDLKTIYKGADYDKDVKLTFRSIASKVRVGLFETIPGYSVKNVKFYTSDAAKASDGKAYLYASGTSGNVFNTEGTYTVYYPTTGSSNQSKVDYNVAHVKFTPAASGTANSMSFGAFAYNATTNPTFKNKEINETSAFDYLGRGSSEPTYSGVNSTNVNYYTLVLPNENGAVLNLKVDYTLLSTDGSGEVINVTGATAMVPAAYTQWKSGYAYTYLFKISDNTNGTTGTGSDPAGLYPITFDAVVVETETGTQETITTVSVPNITTFGYDVTNKKYVSSSSDYALGTAVYATVMQNGAVVDTRFMTDLHLYKVALRSGVTNYAITEAAVAEAWDHPTDNNITFTHVCTSLYNASNAADVSKVPAEDGTEKTVNAVMFKPTEAGYYAIQYRPTTTAGVYTALSPQPTEGTDVTGKYYEYPASSGNYVKVGTSDGSTYYTLTPTGSVLDAGTSLASYYTLDNGNYKKCVSSDTADGTSTYYTITETHRFYEPGDNVAGLFTIDSDGNYWLTTNATSGKTYYEQTTAPVGGGYVYKVVQIH